MFVGVPPACGRTDQVGHFIIYVREPFSRVIKLRRSASLVCIFPAGLAVIIVPATLHFPLFLP